MNEHRENFQLAKDPIEIIRLCLTYLREIYVSVRVKNLRWMFNKLHISNLNARRSRKSPRKARRKPGTGARLTSSIMFFCWTSCQAPGTCLLLHIHTQFTLTITLLRFFRSRFEDLRYNGYTGKDPVCLWDHFDISCTPRLWNRSSELHEFRVIWVWCLDHYWKKAG